MRKSLKVCATILGFLSYKSETAASDTFDDGLKSIGVLGLAAEKMTDEGTRLNSLGILAKKTGMPVSIYKSLKDTSKHLENGATFTDNDLAMILIENGMVPGGFIPKGVLYAATHPDDFARGVASTFDIFNPFSQTDARRREQISRDQIEKFKLDHPFAIVDVDREFLGIQAEAEDPSQKAYVSDPAIEAMYERQITPTCGSIEYYEQLGETDCADSGLTQIEGDAPMEWRLVASSIPGNEHFPNDTCLPLKEGALAFGKEYASLFLSGICSISKASGDGDFGDISLSCGEGRRQIKAQKYGDGTMNVVEVEMGSGGERWDYSFTFAMCDKPVQPVEPDCSPEGRAKWSAENGGAPIYFCGP